MRALTFDVPKTGRPRPRLADVPMPVARQGEVLIRVTASPLNNGDREAAMGEINKTLLKRQKKHPVVSGIEVAGYAETAHGDIKVDDPVVGYTNIFKGPWTHADYVALPAEKVARLPEGLSPEDGAAIIGGALTVIAALEKIADLEKGDRVLITGASGSVGIMGVQFASALGAEVTALCHSSQQAFVQEQGATRTLAYDADGLDDLQDSFDVVFDTAPVLSFAKAGKWLTPRGTYITTMPHWDVMGFLRALISGRKWGFLLEGDTDAKRMSRLITLMGQGVFRPIVDSRFPPEEAAQAFARFEERGKRGKVMLTFGPDKQT